MAVKGLGELSNKLNRLSQNARDLGGSNSVSMTEVLSADFMRRNTRFESLDAFFEASGFDVSSQEAFKAIPDDEIDQFVRSETKFLSWSQMLQTAGAEWGRAKLMKGVK